MLPEREAAAVPAARGVPYALLCTLLGLALGWVPRLIHGPHPWKFTMWRLNGDIAVWGFYTARMFVGLLVGITHWPARWYLRGPLCGILALLPLGFIALANPACGYT
jgi:hypothetical protein